MAYRTLEASKPMAKLTGLEAIESQKVYLQFLGIWALKHETVSYKLRYYLTVAMMLGFTSLCLLEIPKHLDDYGELSELLCLSITPLVVCLKVISIKSGRTHFLKLLQNMEENPVDAGETEMLDAIKFSKRLTRTCTTVCTVLLILFCLQPLQGKQDLPVLVTYNLGRYKNLMYGFQVLSGGIISTSISFVDCLTINVINVGRAKLEILGKRIRSTSNLKNNLLNKEFSHIVTEHNGIIQYIRYVEKVFTYCLLAQYFNSIGAMCNLALQLTRVDITIAKLALMVMYLSAMLSQLGLYCWFGNEILMKSQNILQACYECKWYEYDIKIRKSIFIIMECSKTPLKLTAANLATLSLQSFGAVIRSSYSFFTVMQRMYGKSKDGIQ